MGSREAGGHEASEGATADISHMRGPEPGSERKSAEAEGADHGASDGTGDQIQGSLCTSRSNNSSLRNKFNGRYQLTDQDVEAISGYKGLSPEKVRECVKAEEYE